MKDYFKLTAEEEKTARRTHDRAVVIDGLCYMFAPKNDAYLTRLVAAGVTATHATVTQILDNFEQAVRRIADWRESMSRHAGLASIAETAGDVRRAKKEGRTSFIMGFQDTKPLENELKLVDVFYRLGVRIIQLTYQYRNFVGGGCGETDPGLTQFGRLLIDRMNGLGMLVDLSHCGPRTSREAIEYSKSPCVFTHAGVTSLCNHVRTKTDDLITAVAERGGFIGLPNYAQFLDVRKNRKPTLADFIDVIDYLVALVGVDHVTLGLDLTPDWVRADYEEASRDYPEIYLDFTYDETQIRGLRGIENIRDITRGLFSRGYAPRDISKVMGGNFLRVFEQVCG